MRVVGAHQFLDRVLVLALAVFAVLVHLAGGGDSVVPTVAAALAPIAAALVGARGADEAESDRGPARRSEHVTPRDAVRAVVRHT
ncbi:hypothetical protein BRC99_05145 [Halobacteriales archaeon QS_7_69_60]|nr:MAG: hypothetical protein BRC99_05145 [Halobacteriales archaeon QS_7_69_60]